MTERRGVRWGVVAAVVAALLVIYLIATEIAATWLWFREVGFQSVYTTRLAASVLLFVVFGLAMALGVGSMMWLAQRMRPRIRPEDTSAMLARYRELIQRRSRTSIILPALAFGLLAGVSAVERTDMFLAWRHATGFGVRDPWTGLDVSFFVFSYPWWRFVVGFAMSVVVAALVGATLTHFANGALRTLNMSGPPGVVTVRRRSPFDSPAQAHLSVMMGVLLVLYGLSSLLDRYGFAINQNSLFTGVGYTDHHARMTGKVVIAVISFVCAALFFANARVRRWSIPGLAILVMLVASLVVQGIYPAALQRFHTKPSEQELERPYLETNIAATRAAFGIDRVEIEDYPAVTTASAGQLRSDAAALPAIRLMDPARIPATFEQRQQVRGYYSFPSVLDVDRYNVNGTVTDAVVAAREIDVNNIPDRSWNNLHTVYTHGYGLVAAYGNQRESNGEPVWLAGNIPNTGPLKESQPRIYYGERASQYVVVGAPEGTAPVELDIPTSGDLGAEQKTTYDGAGGVSLSNPLSRVLFATHFADLNLILSDRVNSESKLLFNRQPAKRVAEVAPWLTLDQDPFPAVVDGRIVWILDGYTLSANYPNSTRTDLRTATADSRTETGRLQQSQPVNYMRNAVKAVVDAYDGTVTLYAWDEDDPILQTWMKVYPGVVKPKSAIQPSLLSHVRYPQDLFKVQREVLGRYHTTNPYTLIQGTDLWRVPNDPVAGGNTLEPPYYLSIKWPGDSEPVFSQTTLFVPDKRENLRAYLAVNADAASSDYGTLRILRMEDAQQIAGPSQTMNAITTNPVVAERLRPFLNQGSAQAHYGNLMTLPLGGGLLYVQPIYTQRVSSNQGGYPALRFVVVRFGEQVGIGDTLQQALDQVFGGDSGADTGEDPTDEGGGSTTTNPTVTKLLAEADAAFKAAEESLKNGDLAGYQKQVQVARAKVAEALALSGR
ncbi:UPF0182 family membrane protein [Aestuariimicrobium ganziense]|uniref:UPF0182 family membrane protein n=1 Tax=Aestuariimicrobium ganziense TaxID=2773677 RepID=UPI001942070B|nr:UPF0182 family protein [Aestuariimicrobium ganziense]